MNVLEASPRSATVAARRGRTAGPRENALVPAELDGDAIDRDEARRAVGYPLSRWYLRPLAEGLSRALAPTVVRPWHATLLGAALAASSGALLVVLPQGSIAAGGLLLAAWFCDRLDGLLARRQGTTSRWGSWLDGNVDEFIDLAWHAAAAWGLVLAGQDSAGVAYAAFAAGKYLFLHSLASERDAAGGAAPGSAASISAAPGLRRLGHALYHLPGNADVRLHGMVLAAAAGWQGAGLWCVAAYYHFRWLVRVGLVYRRLARGLA